VTAIHETYSDLFDDDATETTYRVVATLDNIYTKAVPAPPVHETVLAAMRQPANAPSPHVHRSRFPRPLAALIPASLLLLSVGVAGSLRVSAPAPVSADVIIQQAAAVQLPPNSALQAVYRGSYGERYTIWAEYGPRGTIIHSATTGVQSAQGITTEVNRCVGGRVKMRCYNYEAASKVLHQVVTITAADVAKSDPSFRTFRNIDDLTGAGVARLLTRLMHRTPARIHLLPKRRLNGAWVYPIRVDGQPAGRQPTTIYYFDVHGYYLRGMVIVPPRGPGVADTATEYMLLVRRDMIPITHVPAGTFKLHPPHGNQVLVVIP
jgi:hypothetical protein